MRVKKRGAGMALEEIARGLGGAAGGAFAMLPALWTRVHQPLQVAFGEVKDASASHFDAADMQQLVDSLQLARTIAAALPSEDLKVLPSICACFCSSSVAVAVAVVVVGVCVVELCVEYDNGKKKTRVRW